MAVVIAQAGEVLGVPPEWILCGNGSDDILTILTRALVSEGQRLRMPTPSYILYRTLASIQGAGVEEIPFAEDWTPQSEFWQPKSDVKLAVIPNPNSPTGTVVSQEVLRAGGKQLNCPLLIDEAYADFADENAINLVREDERFMVCRTLSKSYGLAGLRFGFLVAQPTMIDQLIKVKDSYNCDTLSIAAATAAIADQTWFTANRAKIVATRERLSSRLVDLGFSVIPSQANFVWCEHRSAAAEELFTGLKQQRILVRYMNYAGWREGLRISVGTDEQIDACLAVLESLV